MTEQQTPTPADPQQPAPATPTPATDVVEAARTEARAVATELLAPVVEAAAQDGVTDGPYAAYDTTYQRFLPGTFPTTKAARDAAKAAGAGRVEIRDVSVPVKASRKR